MTILNNATVLFNNLKTPSVFKGNKAFDLTVALNPTNAEEAQFLQLLTQQQAKATGGKEPVYNIIKKRKVKDKEGKLLDHDTDVMIKFKNKDQPTVINKEKKLVEGDDLNLSFGTKVDIHFEIKDYKFNNGTQEVSGITLRMTKVIILSTPKDAALLNTSEVFSR